MRAKYFLALCISSAVITFVVPPKALAQSHLDNENMLSGFYGTSMYSTDGIGAVKIAILDNGFRGYEAGSRTLPKITELIPPAREFDESIATAHGFAMAQTAWGLMKRPKSGPHFFLVPALGYTNFKAAIDFVIEKKIDIVIYSQVWEFGTNFDGTGFINAEVNRATNAGVIWLNAAGNYNNLVFNTPIKTDENTGLVLLPGPLNSLRFENLQDANNITLTLSWSDFKETDEYNTNKDLDFELINELGIKIPLKNKIQRGEAPPEDEDSDLSSFAREQVNVKLDRGIYSIRVANKSQNFNAATDSMRVTLYASNPTKLQLLDQSLLGDSVENGLLAPADNESVFTVGDCSMISARGTTKDGRQKPDVVMPLAEAFFSDEKGTVSGSSIATAIFGGIVALMKATVRDLSANTLRSYIKTLKPLAKNSNLAKELGRPLDCGKAPVWRTPAPADLRLLK